MTTVRMPDGGKAWFVRYRKQRGCGMKPVSLEGHLLTFGFAAWVTGIAWWLADHEIGTAGLISAIAVILASTLLYIVTALRMSASRGNGR